MPCKRASKEAPLRRDTVRWQLYASTQHKSDRICFSGGFLWLILLSSLLDPAAQPLIDGLVHEYDSRYANLDRPGGARTEILRYPTEAFAAPLGGFLLIQRDGETIAGVPI